jgi:hypothetical protein
MLLDTIERIKVETERRPLCWQEIKMLKMLARQFPEAHELLQKRSQDAPKKRKRFAEIVKETLREEGETCMAWARRIWDQCEKYDTKCPTVISEELLQRYSQGSTKNQKNNLPVILCGGAKSFGRVSGSLATPLTVGGGRGRRRRDAIVRIFNAKPGSGPREDACPTTLA